MAQRMPLDDRDLEILLEASNELAPIFRAAVKRAMAEDPPELTPEGAAHWWEKHRADLEAVTQGQCEGIEARMWLKAKRNWRLQEH